MSNDKNKNSEDKKNTPDSKNKNNDIKNQVIAGLIVSSAVGAVYNYESIFIIIKDIVRFLV